MQLKYLLNLCVRLEVLKFEVCEEFLLGYYVFWTFRMDYIPFNPYPTAFPYGNGIVLHFYQQQESSTTKTVHKVINKGLKTYVYSLHTGENLH